MSGELGYVPSALVIVCDLPRRSFYVVAFINFSIMAVDFEIALTRAAFLHV